jgi:hypothetical protein
MKTLLVAALPLISFATACAPAAVTDELAGEDPADAAGDGKADASIDGTYTYFAVKADLRKCAAPLCGGYFVEQLNRTTTTCADRSTAASCYAPVLDWAESGLSTAQQEKLVGAANRGALAGAPVGIVRGRFAPKDGRFIVTEAWVAETDAVPHGVFVKVHDGGVKCITAPCESFRERALNSSRFAMIAGIEWAESGVSDAQIESLTTALFEQPHGVIIAGDRVTIDGRAKGRTATAVYTRLVDAPQGACFVGGCSGQICSDQEGVISTCEFKPEYACYQTATCGRQSDGTCGWNATPELQACLASAH